MNPEREVISSLEDFVKSWTMDKGKNCPIKFSDQMIPSTSVELDTCAEIFKMDNSPLKPCFSTINPEPFNDMCLKVYTWQYFSNRVCIFEKDEGTMYDFHNSTDIFG